MTIRLGYIAPILLIALPLAACEKDNPFENALTLMNGGQPMPGGPSQPQVSMHLASVPEGGFDEAKPACVDPGWRWGYCDENGDLVLY